MPSLYVQSPCGHGPLVDVVPDGSYERDGKQAWGVVLVVQRHDQGGPARCCSHDEGAFETCEEAQEACERQKQYLETQLLTALALLDGAAEQAWSIARVYLSDLFALRELLAEQGKKGSCEAALCFELGCRLWLVDEERDGCFCEEHFRGKKILTSKGEELVFEAWKQINKAEGVIA
jgi:hypothetical protein